MYIKDLQCFKMKKYVVVKHITMYVNITMNVLRMNVIIKNCSYNYYVPLESTSFHKKLETAILYLIIIFIFIICCCIGICMCVCIYKHKNKKKFNKLETTTE